jgi:8-oxo-dGTP pyrophosphatase MutT (NUDIX family)
VSSLQTFRDSRGLPVQEWPVCLLPSTTIIVVPDARSVHLDTSDCKVLVQQRADNGWWAFVGGRQEIGESIAECAVRETWEESGLEVALVRLICVDSDPQHGAIVDYATGPIQYTNCTFVAVVTGGVLRCSDESRQIRWCGVDALPVPFLPSHRWRLEQARQGQGTLIWR